MRGLSAGVLFLCAMLLTGCSGQSSLIGSYISSGQDDSAAMVQIDSVADKAVRGVVAFVTVDEKGAVDAVRRPLVGTIEDKLLNLTVENGTGVSLITGMVVDDGLEITFFGNGESQKLVFEKRKAGDFDAILADIRRKSAEIKQEVKSAELEAERAKRRLETQRQIDAFSTKLFDETGRVNVNVRKIDAVISGYRATAKRAGELKIARRGLVSAGDEGSYRIDQINYNLETNQDRANSAHTDLQDYARRIEEEHLANIDDAASTMADCKADSLLSCTKLSSALEAYRNAVEALRKGVSRENAAFNTERGKF